MNSKKGAGIVEALVASAVIGAVVFAMSSFYGNTFKAKRKVQVRAVMEFLAKDTASKLQTPAAIYLSTLDPQGNQGLINCLLSAGSGCDETLTTYNPERPNYFALYYPTSKDSFEQMSSGATTPIRYTALGTKCNTPKECVFEVLTYFYASCPSSDPHVPVRSCLGGPQAVHVGYQVKQIPGSLKEFGTDDLPPIPEKPFFFTIPAYLILGSTLNSDCNPGAALHGFDPSGRPLCKCSPPFIPRPGPGETTNGKGPLCAQVAIEGFRCPDALVFRGLNQDGTPRCVNPNDAYECKTVKGAQGLPARCDPEYWVSMSSRSNCKFYCTVGKGGGSCNSNENAEDRVSRADGMYRDGRKWGLICDPQNLTCCKPK